MRDLGGSAGAEDRAAVEASLGRPPRGGFAVVVRDSAGRPVVIENAPFLDDGTPMPTRFWLVDPALVKAVSRLEADGGVAAAESAVEEAALASAHRRYAEDRQVLVERLVARGGGREKGRPSGGVGGTRAGVKCLHAHLAYWLVGGPDPVGAWTAARLGLDRPGSRAKRPGAGPGEQARGQLVMESR